MLTDLQGDGERPCSSGVSRALCCTPTASDDIEVPFHNIFPSDVPSSAVAMDIDFTPELGASQGKEGVGSSSNLLSDNDVDHEGMYNGVLSENVHLLSFFLAFGEVFISSPNPTAVSAMNAQSNWALTSCSPTSDQPQSVRLRLHHMRLVRHLTLSLGPRLLYKTHERT
jgi:hypothetical protein